MVPLDRMLQECVEDLGAFSREKYGVVPAITIVNHLQLANAPSLSPQQQQGIAFPGPDSILCVQHFIRFVIAEVLKNSIYATVEQYGVSIGAVVCI